MKGQLYLISVLRTQNMCQARQTFKARFYEQALSHTLVNRDRTHTFICIYIQPSWNVLFSFSKKWIIPIYQ